MPEYLAPGVFVEEIDSGAKPIEGVSTSTAAFIGYAKSGDFNRPTLVTSWKDFVATYGEEENAITIGLCQELQITVEDLRAIKKASRKGWTDFAPTLLAQAKLEGTGTVAKYPEFARKYSVSMETNPYIDNCYLAHAVNGFFSNGGTKAYIVRIPHVDDVKALSYDQDAVSRTTVGPLLVTATHTGPAALSVEVQHRKPGKFALVVKAGADTVTIPEGDEGANYTNIVSLVDAVPEEQRHIHVAILDPRVLTPPPAKVYTLTGGHAKEKVLELSPGNVLAMTPLQIGAAPAHVKAGQIDFIAQAAGQEGTGISVDLEITTDDPDATKVIFSLSVQAPGEGAVAQKLENLTLATVEQETQPKENWTLVTAQLNPLSRKPLASNLFTLGGGVTGNLPVTSVYTLDDVTASPLVGSMHLIAGDLIGEVDQSGAKSIAGISDISILCAPDLMAGAWARKPVPGAPADAVPEEVPNLTDRQITNILANQKVMLDFCELGRRMVILDPLPGLKPQEMLQAATVDSGFASQRGQGCIYYPWIKVLDPINIGRQLFVPPCGHIAGMWARVSDTRGVHKAPANEGLMGAVALERQISKPDQEVLNPAGINCIRSFPGRGIVVWGARTVATTSNPSWKYINVRRLFNFLEESLDRGTQWTVFEPNDQRLWGKIRRDVGAFLSIQWREGKLFGEAPTSAFYVKCDATNNPTETRDAGRLYVEIGVNPVKPAEFVIIQIGQWSGGGSIMEA